MNDTALDTQLMNLLERMAQREAAALRQLYDLTSRKLYGVALRVVSNPAHAEDVLQDAYLNIWRTAESYQSALSPPMAWMGLVVRSRALDFLRKRTSERALNGPEFDEATTQAAQTLAGDFQNAAPNPMDTSMASQQAWALHECLRKIEAQPREVVTLAYFQDLSHSELAARLRLPLGTVKTWVRRSLDELRRCLSRF
jgi:RNA polymerase sigma factor (sigma-70 family)